jgi:Methyltransferase domain
MSEESGQSGAVVMEPAAPAEAGEPQDVVEAELVVRADLVEARAGAEGEADPIEGEVVVEPLPRHVGANLPVPVTRVSAETRVTRRPPIRSVEPPLDRQVPNPSAGEPVTVSSVGRAWWALVEAVGDELDHRQRLWVLEAGAGTRTLFDLPEDAYVVGVDRDPWALERNARLDERVLADVANYRPLATGFDLINSWYVLDGLDDPSVVLERFAQWTGEQGLIVIAVPNLRSPRGLGSRLFGKAKLRRSVTMAGLRRHFTRHGFTPLLQVSFEDATQIEQRRRLRIVRGRWTALQLVVRILSFGLLDAARTDLIVVYRKDR